MTIPSSLQSYPHSPRIKQAVAKVNNLVMKGDACFKRKQNSLQDRGLDSVNNI